MATKENKAKELVQNKACRYYIEIVGGISKFPVCRNPAKVPANNAWLRNPPCSECELGKATDNVVIDFSFSGKD